MSGYGYTATSNQYEGTVVFDSDQIESDIISGGHDNLYTDVTGTTLEYLDMHGTCGNYPHGEGSCTSDSNCQHYVSSPPSGVASGLTWGCDTHSGTCSGWDNGASGNYDRYTITCSPFDTFGHGADITSQIYFGEYAGITFGNDAQNGDVHFLALDTSCPFALPFIIQMNANMFTGLHFELGFSTSPGGDDASSEYVAEDFGTRLHNGETIATAWSDASVIDDSGDQCGHGGLCLLSLTCNTQSEASWRLSNETLTSGPNHTSAPAWCYWYYDCC